MYTKQQVYPIVKHLADVLGKGVVAFRCCLDCIHFDEEKEVCAKWNARPPARVIVNGCDDHVDKIPF